MSFVFLSAVPDESAADEAKKTLESSGIDVELRPRISDGEEAAGFEILVPQYQLRTAKEKLSVLTGVPIDLAPSRRPISQEVAINASMVLQVASLVVAIIAIVVCVIYLRGE